MDNRISRLARLWHGFGSAISAWSTRQDLRHLDDRMLKDVGVSRAQATFEASRAPWQLGSPDFR